MISTVRSRLATLGAGALLVPLALTVPASADPPPGTWDLGPDAVVTASTYQDDQDGTFPPENAVDGDPTTRWSSANGPDADVEYPQWFQLDLGQVADVSGLTLAWEAAYAVGYTVEVAQSDPAAGGTWQQVHATAAGTGGTEEIAFESAPVRWMRVSMTERVPFDWDPATLHWYGYSLYEVQVWGTTAQPTLGFAAASSVVDAGETATVPVRLAAPAADDVTVRVTSADGSATAGEDYTAVDQVLTFPAGTTEQAVDVTSVDHGPLAGDRTLTLALTDLTGSATLGPRDRHELTLRAHGELPSDGARIPVDDFEDGVGTIFPWGDGAASTPVLTTIPSTRPGGGSALQAAVPGMTSWGGFSHDLTEAADWSEAGAFSLWFLGTGSGKNLRFELKSGGTNAGTSTLFEHTVVDDAAGWREIVVQFSSLREKNLPASTERFDPTNVWGYAVTLTDLGAGTWVFDDVSVVERTLTIMDFEGDVPLSTDADPVGIFAWGGDDASRPTLEVVADDRDGTAAPDNHVLAGTYQVSTWGGISHNLAAAQAWSTFGGIRFWWYASQDTRPASPTAGDTIRVELKDGGPHGEASELWVATFLDNWSADGSRWKLVELPFSAFSLRTDFQPGSGDTLDGELTLDRAWGYALTMPVGTATPVGYRIDDVAIYGSASPASAGVTVAPRPQTVLVDGGEDAVVSVAVTTRDAAPLPADVEVAWSLAPGTAEEGVDYAADAGTLVFAAGEPSGTAREITVPTIARDGELTARTIDVVLTTADATVASSATVAINAQGMAYLDPAVPDEERVADLLARMTLAEKIGQMTQAERLGLSSPDAVATHLLGSVLSGGGSVPADNTPSGWADMVDAFQRAALSTRLQIPILYGVDAVHGHSNMVGATIFPHNIGIGAARDVSLIEAQGEITAAEVRASGIPWTFAPTLAVSGDERWGRSYESFGEDPALVSLYSGPAVRGLQGEDPSDIGTTEVLATAKHWVGDGSTAYDPSAPGYPIDQGISSYTDLADLLATDVAPYRPALDAGVGSIMPSYSAVVLGDGDPVRMHEHTALTTDLLKGELGFDGFVVSDWEGINKLPGGTYAQKAVRSVSSGVDMAMAPYDYAAFIDAITAAVAAGEVSQARVDDAVTRILVQKFALGLFDSPFADRTGSDSVGSAEHRAVARRAAADSQVLLSNDGVLPLSQDANVYVAGSTADDLGRQMGGWTISWQGGTGATTEGTTIGAAITAATSGAVTISPDASAPMDGADVGVVVVGEPPYAEGVGDVGENGFTLALRPDDVTTIGKVCAAMDCVVLVVSGRPQITSALEGVDALVASWLPGSEGDGVADVLFGTQPFTGRLPVTWPASADQVPINVGDDAYAPQFAFGWGLRTDDPQARLVALAGSLPVGAAQDAVAAAADAAYWDEPTPAAAVEALGLLQRAGAQLRGTDAFADADLAVSAARDIVQSVIAGGTDGFTVAGEHASLTSDGEHALLGGEPGTAVRLLAAAVGIALPATGDLPGDDRVTPSIRATAVGLPTRWGTPTIVGATLTSAVAAPTGSVRVLDGERQVGAARLVRIGSRTSVAAETLWLTGRGTHTLTVVYDGDAKNRPVTSREMRVRVR